MKQPIDNSRSIAHIFEIIRNLDGTIDDKARLLRAYRRKDILWLIDFMYNYENIDFEIPEYKPSTKPYGINFSTLVNSLPTLKAAIKHKENRKVYTRNLTIVLESISKEESDLLVNILKGKKIEGVSKAVIKRAFPDYFPVDLD